MWNGKLRDKVLISVIIPTLNSAATIQNTLRTIFSNDFPQELFEVILVDNGSSDGTEKAIEDFPVRFLKCPRRGQAPARNLGLKHAKGEIICFTDSDAIIPRDWLAKVSGFLRENSMVDGVGGLVLPPREDDEKSIRKIAGEIYVERQGFPSVLARTQYLKYSGSLYTANSAYRKMTLEACSGFNESLWKNYYYSDGCDIDLSWRLVKMGRNLVFNPDIVVYHYAPRNLQGVFRQLFGWGAIYTMLMKKHGYQGSLREKLWLFSYLASSFYSLLIAPLSNPRKRLLKLFYVSSFNVGRVAGYRTWKKERLTDQARIVKTQRAEGLPAVT